MKYRHIFFDLDHTLYDFDESTRITFRELYDKYKLERNGVKPFDRFLELYKKNNVALWERYRNGEIRKKYLNVERFHVSLLHFGINDRAFAGRFAAEYVRLSPQNEALFPAVVEVLSYLKEKYALHIITNGFDQVQRIKLKSNNLEKYFSTVTTSEEAGARKPNVKIFHFAMNKAGATPSESIMIGDDLQVDILGARLAGMDQILVASDETGGKKECTFMIQDLLEVKRIL
ncbi:MAG: YjjG family noncanonical pyrimidine nucleotidase [Bacteroidales bacterium]